MLNLTNICPECGEATDMVSDVEGNATPSENDISICFCCGAINMFDVNVNLIEMSQEELDYIKQEEPETYKQMMDAVIHIKARR